MRDKVSTAVLAINASASLNAKQKQHVGEREKLKNVPLTHGDHYFLPSTTVYFGSPSSDDHLVLTIHGSKLEKDGKAHPEWPAVLSLRESHCPEGLSLESRAFLPKKGRRWLSLADMPITGWRASDMSALFVLMDRLGRRQYSVAYGSHHREHGGLMGRAGDLLKGTVTASVSASTVLFLATRLREKHANVADADRMSYVMFSLAGPKILKDLADLSASACVSSATVGKLMTRSVEPITNAPLSGKEGQLALLLANNVAEHIAALQGQEKKCEELLVKLCGDGFIQQQTDASRAESSPANAGARVGIALAAAFIAAEKQGADHDKKKLYVKLGFIAAQKLLEACPFISAAGIVLDVAEAIVDYQMDKTGNDVSKTAMAAMANCVFIPAEKINAQPHHASPGAWNQQDLSIFFRWVKHVVNAAGYAC